MIFLTDDHKIKASLEALASELPAAKLLESLTLSLQKSSKKGFAIQGDKQHWKIQYGDISSLFRAVALVAEKASRMETGEIREAPRFERLGILLDACENAVPRPSAVKRLCRLLSSLGYNTLILKTVKGDVIDANISFDTFAGRYTADELCELTDYAVGYGIELLPCIPFSELPAFASPAQFEATVDRLLLLLSQRLGNRRVCLGFDRPALPGCGPYPAPLGHCRAEELPTYLEIISKLLQKHGMEASMGGAVLQDLTAAVSGITFAAAECTGVDKEYYRSLLSSLSEKTPRVGFVGGDNSWYGAVPLSWLSHTVACNTLPVLLEKPPHEVYVAMWRDDTGAAPLFSTLPVLFAYAEACWAGTDHTEHLSRRMLALCGVDFYDMVPLEDIPAIRCRLNTGRIAVNPGKYMLYDRVINASFAAHATGARVHLRSVTEWMAERIGRAGEFAYLFEALVAYSNLLAYLAEISEGLRKAYRKGDRTTMQEICDGHFKKAANAVDEYYEKLCAQWEREYMELGLALIRQRLDLVKQRLAEEQPILVAYLSGKTDRIDAFESDPRPYVREAELIHDCNAILLNRFDWIEAGNMRT